MKKFLFAFIISLVSLGYAKEDSLNEGQASSIIVRVLERQNDDGTKLPITKDQVDQAVLVIETRLQHMGITSAQMSRNGENGFTVVLPNVEREEAVRVSAKFSKSYKLELREVHPESDKREPDGKILAKKVQDGEAIEPGYRAYKIKYTDKDGEEHESPILLNRRPALSSADVANAMADPLHADSLQVKLNDDGAAKMIALTNKMTAGRDRIAILLDGEVISAPVVQHTPIGKQFIISGITEPGEVQIIAIALINPLLNPITIEEVISNSPKK